MKTKLLKLALCATAMLPLGAWADVENKATATWLFNQYVPGDTVASTAAGSYQVIDHDGLYSVIGHSSKTRNLTTETARMDSDLKDGETTIFSKGWYTGLYFDDGRGKGIDKAANYEGGGGRMSLRINRPGKLYILCRNYNPERLIGVFKDRSSEAVVTSESNTNFQMLTVEIAKSELQSASSYDKNVICHITGYYDNNGTNAGNGFKIYGVKYVVSEDAAQLSKSVTIPSCGYATFSGPHTYTISSVTNSGSATAWYASDESDNKITLAQTGNKRIAPSQGFIIIGTPGETATLKTVEEQTTIAGTNLLVANVAAYNLQRTTSITQGSATTTYYNYILVPDGESNAVFKHTTGTGNLGANKAFLRTTTNVEAVGARGFEFVFEDGTTAINEVKPEGAHSNRYFNINGQEVAQPTKGLYIVNGKKVFIK
ncbi:MAG: hypothetical protein IJ637_04475 [Prevotella sp.]|nr:hypothetical protein [Prevotella sp.]